MWERDPQQARKIANAMEFIQSEDGFNPENFVPILESPCASELIFVDVGGSHGQVSIRLAQRFPQIHCIVQDMPATIRAGAAQLPEELKGRVSFMAHDFWTKQPVKGADIYYFRWVLHDWPDALCLKILRQLIPALKKGARVILSEICMPPPGMLSLYQERWSR